MQGTNFKLDGCQCTVCGTNYFQLQTEARRRVSSLAKASSDSGQKQSTKVKICGVIRPEDAIFAAESGADYIGMILGQGFKRSVEQQQGREIAAAAIEGGAIPVGVFVNENYEQISEWVNSTGVQLVQLHGNTARSALGDIPSSMPATIVIQSDQKGSKWTEFPTTSTELDPDAKRYILLDGMQGGSGIKLDWDAIQVPWNTYRREAKDKLGVQGNDIAWFLAGGLTPYNVAEAVLKMRPYGVDTSSGVCGDDGLAKDKDKIVNFIENAKFTTLDDIL